ncbi:MAG: hypothetical protein NVSMB46_03450 [Candidatus Saccharimonadales bacterium]
MPVEAPVYVDLHPELEQRVENKPEALLCVSGLAFITAAMLEADTLPDFKRSLTIQFASFKQNAWNLSPTDFRDETEWERAQTASSLWYKVGYDTWQELGIFEWGDSHTKINIQRVKKSNSHFIMNIAPFGSR